MFLAVCGRRITAAVTTAAGGALQQLLSQQQQQLPAAAAAAATCTQEQQQQQQQQCHWQQLPCLQQQHRTFNSSRAAGDLNDFAFDVTDANTATNGRAWLAKELRNKSWDDLHKLWYVCLKERNMLLTRIAWAAAEQRKAQQRDSNMAAYRSRIAMVKKTMNRIKQVLSERAHNEADAVKSANMKRAIHYM